MKKLVYSSQQDPEQSGDPNYMTYTRSGQRFGVHMRSDNPLYPKFQISEIHPYDDADYTWARCGYRGAACVEFIRNGKVVDSIQWHSYDEDEYEDENEYLDELVDQVCLQLHDMNSDVKPKIVHW